MDKEAALTPDQVVSVNLTRARELRGWTQQKAAEEISRRLGKDWSVPVYSAAERSHRTARVKEFSAAEVVAFARAFTLPVAWFFLPPDAGTVIAPRGAGEDAAMTGDELLSLLFPRLDDPMLADLEKITEALFSRAVSNVPPNENLPGYLGWVSRQNATLRTMIRSEFEAQNLDELPRILEDAAGRMRQALGLVANDLMHDGIPVPEDSE